MPSSTISKPTYSKLTAWQRALERSAKREQDVWPGRVAKAIKDELAKVEVADQEPSAN